jgi:CDP-2,3-bis-(O-geranylgeranyl)-sn-glycerol synthase
MQVLLFCVPCWLINLSLNLFKFIPGVAEADRPLDSKRLFFDRRPILGKSTTIIGLVVAVALGLVIGSYIGWFKGLMVGLGVYFGHASGSFIKRRLGIVGGDYLPIVDHGDYIFLTGMIFLLFNWVEPLVFLYAFGLTLLVHPFACLVGFKLGLREKPL